MSQFLWAAALIVGVGLAAVALYFNPTWQGISHAWLVSWARHML